MPGGKQHVIHYCPAGKHKRAFPHLEAALLLWWHGKIGEVGDRPRTTTDISKVTCVLCIRELRKFINSIVLMDEVS